MQKEVKVFFLYILVLLLVSCKDQKATRRETEIGDEKSGVYRQEEKSSSPFYEDYEKASLLTAENKLDEAIEIYQELLLKEESKDLAYAGLGTSYSIKGDHRKALDFYQRSLAINPGCASALIGTGSVYLDIFKYDSAILFYNKMRKWDDKNAGAYYGLASAYSELGNIEKAKTNAKRFIELAPESMYRKYMESILSQ